MVLHAVKNYGVTAIGVTLSRQQAEFAQQQISDAGLEGQAQVRFQDYRDVPEAGFDAISSIGLTEHIGASNYPAYFSFLRSRLLPEGRLLNHCITRTDTRQKTQYRKGFINRYVFPDGELVPIGQIIDVMEDEHLEVRHEENLREHYAMTLRDWLVNLDDNWDDAVQEVGRGKARVWRLYMAASRLGFERNWIQLHQVLATRTDDRGSAGVPLRPWF
jgi:cyclopropane-fatty-acyl-phospholipid synthase